MRSTPRCVPAMWLYCPVACQLGRTCAICSGLHALSLSCRMRQVSVQHHMSMTLGLLQAVPFSSGKRHGALGSAQVSYLDSSVQYHGVVVQSAEDKSDIQVCIPAGACSTLWQYICLRSLLALLSCCTVPQAARCSVIVWKRLSIGRRAGVLRAENGTEPEPGLPVQPLHADPRQQGPAAGRAAGCFLALLRGCGERPRLQAAAAGAKGLCEPYVRTLSAVLYDQCCSMTSRLPAELNFGARGSVPVETAAQSGVGASEYVSVTRY